MDILSTDQNDQNQIDPNIDPLEELTGPGKKFDRSKYESESDMYKAIAKGKVEADNYVKHILARHDELREDYKRVTDAYNAGPKLQELIDKFAAQGQQSPTAHTPAVNDDKPVVMDLSKYEEIAEAKYQALKRAEQEEANSKMVVDRLIEHFGSDYRSALKQQIDEIGMSVDTFNNLAKTSPKAILKTLGLTSGTREGITAPPQSSSRSPSFSSGNKRTWSYYQKIRKENPRLYRDPKTQAQMFKDASELGDAFEDGDWHLNK